MEEKISKSAFCEDSRVKFPTLMHLMGMGFKYVSLKGLKTKYVIAPKTEFDPLTNILTDYFTEAYNKLNPNVEIGAVGKLLAKIQSSLMNDDLGRQFYNEILLNTGERIIDLSSPANFYKNNTFQVTTEMTCGDKDSDNYRPDITLFVNGLPLAFIEVKKENYHKGILAETDRMKQRFVNPKYRRFLNLTQIMVFSNDMEYDNNEVTPTIGAFYATIGKKNTKYNCFREEGQDSFPIERHIRQVTLQEEEILLRDSNVPQYKNSSEYKTNCLANTPTKRMCDSLFSFNRFHFLLKYGIAYVDYTNGLQKHIMRYPQLFATKAIERHLEAGKTKGIIWHTQGSGKTALSFYNVKYLTDYYSSKGIVPQFFFIVDRLDLMIQAQREFSYRGLKVNSVQTKDDFAKIISSGLTTQNREGKPEITVVNIQKFSNDSKALPKNAYNVPVQRIYFIDEAHRNYSPDGCFLKNLISSDSNAVKIALTGTPIISKEYNTKDIFGDYIHTYFYNASIADGYTRRLIREDIGSNYKIRLQEALNSIRVKSHSVKESDVYAHRTYVQPLLDYVINDLQQFRVKNEDNTLGGMVVCNSKEQAQMMYRLFLEKYADETELDNEKDEDGAMVYRSISAGEMEIKKTPCRKGCYRAALITYDSFDKETRAKWIELFKDGKIDLLIVFQMLQTGFDEPRLKKLYLHRMVKEHNLLQTLTRVNRPYKEMKYGYVVDFANIEEEYSKTNREYQEELEHEVGKDNLKHTDRLLVTMEEAKSRVDEARKVLAPYELGNPEIFSRQLNMEDDREVVRSIVRSLEDMRSLQNMLTAQGSEAEAVVEISDIHNLIKAARNRLDLLGFIDNADEKTNTRQLLNVALENIEFSFEKRGEGELEIQEQYRQSVEHARRQLQACMDTEDPEYRSILEEFLRLFRRKEMESQEEFNMHDKVQNVNDILKRIKRLNERDALEAIKYNGDTKFVRVEKRLKEKDKEEIEHKTSPRNYAWTEEKEKMTVILLAIKEDVDDVYFHNQAILEVPAYFKRNILTYVTRHFKEGQINTDREVRKYVSEVINREYQVTR
ncbi:MAG: type I restriction endonuclease subunit R [Prevotella salivae]|jgi:Type I site-specific restriction-modification system, R (restriction) subunit and related helicases|uniref:DEAD/DEAH box helicase family protein n=1 Tax=Segatella salivae TaxID=228604 RepID=UPI001CB2ECA7|nr:DEAD/DEAH box helicase family protein [Segatella salivae]MBF1520893.1 type I restriction endonuclease subunit R [Segatella salivae]